MTCQVTSMSRTFSTSSIQREVIQANGQAGSNQKSAVSLSCTVNNRLEVQTIPAAASASVAGPVPRTTPACAAPTSHAETARSATSTRQHRLPRVRRPHRRRAPTGPIDRPGVARTSVCTREVEREVRDHAHDGGRHAGQRGRQRAVVPQPLDVRRAQEDEEEATARTSPRRDQQRRRAPPRPTGRARRGRGRRRGTPRTARTMISGPGVVSASARPRTISPAGQPAVGLDRRLGDVGRARRRRRRRSPAPCRRRTGPGRRRRTSPPASSERQPATGSQPQHEADRPGSTRLRRADGRAWCRASSGISGAGAVVRRRRGAAAPSAAGRQRPSSQPTTPAPSTTSGNGTREDRQRHERGHREADQRPVPQRPPADRGPRPGPRSRAPPAPARGTAPSTRAVSPVRDVDPGQREQRDAARAARTGRPRSGRRAQPLSSQPV